MIIMRDPKFNQLRYDAATITVANGQTNRNIKSNESDLFNTVPEANKTIISTDVTITIRLNDNTNWAIVMTSTESPKVFDAGKVSNLFITNASWGAATVKVELYS